MVPMLVAASSGGSGLPTPNIDEFFPAPFLFVGTPFEFNRIDLVRLVAAVALVLVMWLGTRRLRMVPRRGQVLFETLVDFPRVNISEEIIGKEAARSYTPLLTYIFLAVFFMNMTGIIPLLNIAGTSVIGVPIILAALSYIAFIAAGVKAQGGWKFFKSSIMPPGVPWPIYILLTPIEFASTFIIRPATLTIRLLANMISGHLLLVTFFMMTSYLFFEASGAMKAIGVVSFAAGFVFTLFEAFIAALQAYIFSLLTAVYISLAREAEH